LANSSWIDTFPDRSVEVLAMGNSDHLTLFLRLVCNQPYKHQRRVPFRYNAGWGKIKENKEAIKKIWRVKENHARGWKGVIEKFERTKKI
jgi:acylphosphatase